jgi:hypothetical protein
MKGLSLIRNAAAIAVVAGAAGVVGAVSGSGTGASAASADRTGTELPRLTAWDAPREYLPGASRFRVHLPG